MNHSIWKIYFLNKYKEFCKLKITQVYQARAQKIDILGVNFHTYKVWFLIYIAGSKIQ